MAQPREPDQKARRATSASAAGTELRAAAVDLDEGRPGALERVWDLTADQLYGLALWRTGNPEDAEEVVQEVFVRLARFPAKLRRAREPRAYLMRIAHNASIDLVKGRRPTESLDLAVSFAVVDSGAEVAADAASVSRHLTKLPPAQREAVWLRFFGGLSLREIGSVTGVSSFTAATRCRLAINRLRAAMGVKP